MRSNRRPTYSGAGGVSPVSAAYRSGSGASTRRSSCASSSSVRPAIAASANRPRMRSISRVPRCQQRNNSRLRRSSRPSLDRVDPVIFPSNPNAKSPDVPGRVDIAMVTANVSSCRRIAFAPKCIQALGESGTSQIPRVPAMRPPLLNPLFAPVTSLGGVGPKQDRLFRYLLGRDETPRLVDLLLHLPASVIDRRARPKIRDAVPGTVVTLEVTVDRHRPPPPRNARAPFLVYASDDTGDVVLTYFRAQPGYVEKLLPVGAKRYVSGTLQMYDGILQIVHPDRIIDEAGFAKLSGIDPVYPLTEGLALGSLRRAMAQALQKLPDLPEWISPEVIRRCKFPPIAEALNRVHIPVELTDILPDGPFWSRLAFDELLAGSLAPALGPGPTAPAPR